MDLVAGKQIEPKTYELIATRAVDGDSIAGDLVIELADSLLRVKTRLYVSVHIRLRGIDAPEVVGVDRAAGLASKMRMAELLFGATCTATVSGRDKYGRLLADVTANGIDVSQTMLAEGLAKPNSYRGESHESPDLWSDSDDWDDSFAGPGNGP